MATIKPLLDVRVTLAPFPKPHNFPRRYGTAHREGLKKRREALSILLRFGQSARRKPREVSKIERLEEVPPLRYSTIV